VILSVEAFASQDHENLKPMLEGAKKNLVSIGKTPDYFEGKELTADSNYHSLNSLTVCKNEKVDAYIPDIQFRQRDPRFADQERFKDKKKADDKSSPFSTADFTYDESKRVYRCPNGKELKCHARGQLNRHRTYDVYHARAEDCAACRLRSRCLSKSDTSRRYLSIQVDTGQPNLIDLMKAKIDNQAGQEDLCATVGHSCAARSAGVVESVFANICVHKHMDRFTLRSKRKVDVQWPRTRLALVHNIGKIHVFGALI
jgi:hypothetical protein